MSPAPPRAPQHAPQPGPRHAPQPARPASVEPGGYPRAPEDEAGWRPARILAFAGSAALLGLGGLGILQLPHWLEPGPAPPPPALLAAAPSAAPPPPAAEPLASPAAAPPQDMAALQAEIARLLATADQLDADLSRELARRDAEPAPDAAAPAGEPPPHDAGLQLAGAVLPAPESTALSDALPLPPPLAPSETAEDVSGDTSGGMTEEMAREMAGGTPDAAPAAPEADPAPVAEAPPAGPPPAMAEAATAAPPAEAPAEAPVEALAAPPPVPLPPGEVAALLRAAEEQLTLGAVEPARQLYRQAAQGGSSRAAAALGRTYEPDFLRGIGAAGTPADALLALVWSRRAAALAAQEPAVAAEAPLPATPEPPAALPAPAPVATLPPAPSPAPPETPPPAPEAAAVAAPVPAPVPAPAPVAAPRLAPEALEAILRRAEEMLALRDISAARRLFAYAAEAGSGRAAAGLGRTYDPAYLAGLGVRGIRADPALAARWSAVAEQLGEAAPARPPAP
ncbi:hypothetical protein [Roseomonas sp. USHLN139]|uniref:hypothetical protein n=1 Tax=Roseomonas sp. USHLN139 TaxID=3081298 RepID=UPI003B014F64